MHNVVMHRLLNEMFFSVQAMIDISGKKDQHVVKCNSCNEATPIRNAPPGRKYELLHNAHGTTHAVEK